MKTQSLKKNVLMGAAIGVLSLCAFSNAQAQDFSAEQKKAIEEIVQQYIMDNPNLIVESIQNQRLAERQKQLDEAQQKISEYKDELTADSLPSVGNPNGDITIVEFFDYNCGYCKRALPDIQKVLESDDNVRVVLKDLPILGPSSEVASRWALAAHKQDRYFDYHVALMNHKGSKTEAEMKKIGTDLGLDVAKLEEDANSEDITARIEKSREVAQEIGVRGTPAFVVGDKFYPGYIDAEKMKAAIAEQRQKKNEDG